MSRAMWQSPESNSSISGSTPTAFIRSAMIRTLRGVLITTSPPEFMVLRSSVQMSGLSSSICSTRFSGVSSVVPGPAMRGSSIDGTKRPPGPVVRLMTTSLLRARMRPTTSR